MRPAKILLFLLLACLIGGFVFFRNEQSSITDPSIPTPPPDLLVLYNQARQSPALSFENIQEEQQIIDQQVATAQEWLNDAHPKRRISGAEQLAAYPTPEAEMALSNALAYDIDDRVRAAAALSLAGFKELDMLSINTLLNALEDSQQKVQLNALHTLNKYLLKLEPDSPPHRYVLQSLEKKSYLEGLDTLTRQALSGLLADIKN